MQVIKGREVQGTTKISDHTERDSEQRPLLQRNMGIVGTDLQVMTYRIWGLIFGIKQTIVVVISFLEMEIRNKVNCCVAGNFSFCTCQAASKERFMCKIHSGERNLL
ncbi:hypothetical protein LINPERPRIM_LOCUS4473 [Linum perenne]